jgi:Fe2+ transport system protein FeoA
MHNNETAVVYDINREDISVLKKILMMGLLPGVKIKLIRNFPSYLYEIYNSRFVIDKELASKITVELDKKSKKRLKKIKS